MKEYDYAAYTKKYYEKIRYSGRCVSCTNPAEKGKVKCKKHNEYTRKYIKKRIKARKAAGLCIVCAIPAKHMYQGRIMCLEHLKRAREYNKRFRAEHSLQELCIMCWQPAVNNLYCDKHIKKVKQYAKVAAHNYYHAQKARGKCVRCARRALKNLTTCSHHRFAA